MVGLLRKLVEPHFPQVSIGLESGFATVVKLRARKKNQFVLRNAAHIPLPENLLIPDCDAQNIQNHDDLIAKLRYLFNYAGIDQKGIGKLSLSLPESSTKMIVVSIQPPPKASGREVEEMLDWKIEKSLGAAAHELRISKQQIDDSDGNDNESNGSDGRNYIVSAIRLSVLAEYEELFSRMRMKVGLVMPRCLAESLWLRLGLRLGSRFRLPSRAASASKVKTDKIGDDKLLLSTSSAGISIVISNSDGNPLFVRSIRCLAGEMPDELFRALMYYRDRIVGNGSPKKTITSFLLTGIELSEESVVEIIHDVLSEPQAEADAELKSLTAKDFGLDLPSETNLNFPLLAAPAGLAAINYI